MSRTLKLATKDNDVMDISAVQIEITESQEQKSMITLACINTEIATITGQIQQLQARLIGFQALRDEITALAETVKLKVESIEI